MTLCSNSGSPTTTARYRLSTLCSANCWASFKCAKFVFATTITPDVPLSSLWTIPSLSGPAISDSGISIASNALTSVPLLTPARDEQPFPWFVNDEQVVVFVKHRQGNRLRLQSCGFRFRQFNFNAFFASQDKPGLVTVILSILTHPFLITCWQRDRDKSGKCLARKLSSLMPANSCGSSRPKCEPLPYRSPYRSLASCLNLKQCHEINRQICLTCPENSGLNGTAGMNELKWDESELTDRQLVG